MGVNEFTSLSNSADLPGRFSRCNRGNYTMSALFWYFGAKYQGVSITLRSRWSQAASGLTTSILYKADVE